MRAGQAAFNLNYGRIAGELSVTTALAHFLTRGEPGADAGDVAKRLLVTSGVSHSLEALCAALTQPGDTVLVVRPTYFLASGVFRDHGLHLVEVPSGCDGLDLLALEALLKSGVQPRLLYVVPTHANPTGCTLPAASRRSLVELAERYQFFIVADEVYHALSWGQEPVPPRMSTFETAVADSSTDEAFDGEDRPLDDAHDAPAVMPRRGAVVCSCGSLTKVLAPGVRLGWVEAPSGVLTRLANRAYLVSGGGVAPFSSLVVLEAMRSGGLQQHLSFLCQTYARRCAVLCDALRAAARNTGWTFVQPSGGYFVWLRLPDDVGALALVAAAKARRVAVLAGLRCCAAAAPAPLTGGASDACQHVRLCFAYLDDAALRLGVQRLEEAVADVRAGSASSGARL